jgi:hypothetical protein
VKGTRDEGSPRKKSWRKVRNQVLDMLKRARQLEGKLSRKRNALKFKSTGFLFAQTPEVPSLKPRGSGVWKPRATQTGEPGGSGKIPGGSGVCKDKTKKKGKV